MKSDASENSNTSELIAHSSDHQPVDEIIYRLSHDLRASTRALSELPSWIQEDMQDAGLDMPQTVRECMILMQDHAQRLNKMIDGLLQHSRVGRTPASVMDAGRAVKKALALCAVPETARLRSHLQPGTVEMSMPDLEMVVQILVSNALVHATANTRIAITGSVETAKPGGWPGNYWVLKVRDTGPGIPERHWADVFKIMVSLHAASEHKGVGMGLAILEKIAHHYGGQVWIAQPTRKRQGATLCLALPLVNETAIDLPPNAPLC